MTSPPVVPGVVARVAGKPIPASQVTERLAALRAGRYAGLLPRQGRESRQLRRWIGQLVVAEAVCETAARRDGLAAAPDPLPLDEVATVELGSLASAVLDGSPYARAVYRELWSASDVPDRESEEYYRRNRDLFRTPEALTSGGEATLPYQRVREQILGRLRDAAARRQFLHWLDAQTAAIVDLSPGWEHPGDPTQPDNTHRH